MTSVSETLNPPVVIWDGECGFCRRWIEHWQELVGDDVLFIPFQHAAEGELERWGLDPVACGQAMHFVDENETVHRGAGAVLTLLRDVALRFRVLHAAYRHVPGFGAVTDAVYRFIAQHRVGAARATRLLVGTPQKASYQFAQQGFMRLLGLASFVAFWSLWLQTNGLFSSSGILPISDFLVVVENFAGRTDGESAFGLAPSLFWLGASDLMIRAVATGGMVASVLLAIGIVPRLMAALLWVAYLSFVTTGQVFLGYQWDALLLESLFVGCFFLPLQLWPGGPGSARETPWVGRWLVWFLVFKLMLLSGWVKWEADEVWRNLTALDYHFWTQPIPNLIAPWADALPMWMRRVGTAFTLVAESFAPLLVFAPRRLRHAGALTMIALQLAIAATGTYGFFNLLTIALCVALFDDQFWAKWTGGRWTPDDERRSTRIPAAAKVFALSVGAIFILTPMAQRMTGLPTRGGALDVTRFVDRYRTFNSYGLFANMTEERPEIVVEGSLDGEEWFTYDFRWKPTDVDEPLRFTTLHMPRVDWQMWFTSLGDCQRNRWFHAFSHRLLTNEPGVTGLLEVTPPYTPRFIRSRRFLYAFGDDSVWSRVEKGEFCPVFTLDEQGELAVARPQ